MIPFLNSPLVSLQHKLCILQSAAGERSLFNFLARGQSKEQAQSAFWHAENLFRDTYEQLLMQPKGTFHPSHPGKHKEQSELPRHHGGNNLPVPPLAKLHEPAAAGAMVGIVDFLAKCKLLPPDARDPQQWHRCTSARLRDASTSIRTLIGSPYFKYMNTPKTAEIFWTLVDPPIEGDDNSEPRANYQKIHLCRALNMQKFLTEIRFTEIKAGLMGDPTVTISRQVKHRFQVASQRGSGTASLVVPTEKCLEMDDAATIQAICSQNRPALLS
jgi:hypothetical protein